MVWVIVVLAALVVLLVLAVIAMYNRLVRLRNRAENAWSQVDVQLRRRYDLIPNLVETVKGYASHERATFEEVTKARMQPSRRRESRTRPRLRTCSRPRSGGCSPWQRPIRSSGRPRTSSSSRPS